MSVASGSPMTHPAVLSGTRLATQLGRAERRKKLRALALTLPLLVFLVVFFLVPLASLLIRAVENPEVADALPRTGQARAKLLEQDERWGELPYWQTIAKNSSRWTPDYLLASVDLKRTAEGEIVSVGPDAAAFSDILVRTFAISAIVTLAALLLGYPLAYWLATLSERKANILLILVLLPFWTSVLVRIAAWIVLLQNNGLVNRFLMWVGVTDAPIPLLFNRLGVIIAMVHILLPFMILPLYSVMKSVPPNYLRAAISLGSPPLAAFFRVYLPQTYPGVAAGGLLVFITCIGYYVTPALLGGPGDQMLSYYVAQYTNVVVNWGMACALGSVLLVCTLVLYALYRKLGKAELSLG